MSNFLKPGAYNVIVFGIIEGKSIRKLDVHIETTSGKPLNVMFLSIPSTGLSNFRKFTRFAKFQLDEITGLTVVVTNISKNDIKQSQLLFKRLLFNQNIKEVEIGITPRFNYLKFFLLIVLNIGAFFLLLLQ